MQRTAFYQLRGTLNLVTPAIETPPGDCIGASNYESVEKGYRRIDGIEVFDGQPKPSAASYWILNFDAGTVEITEGQTVTGADSSASGKALVDGVLESGTYAGGDAAGYLVLTNVSGTFQDNENLQVAAATKCVSASLAVEKSATTDALHSTYLEDAIETARALIAAPTGSGAIRGGFTYKGTTYCFRDNAGATACQLWKETTAGWSLQSLGFKLSFTSGGTTEIAEGDVITGASSGCTATITRVVLQSGAWADGDAAGYFIFASQSTNFQSENLDVGASANLATIAGDSTAITLTNGGKYDIAIHNFFGASDLERVYGCNGLDQGFEWDGTVFVPLDTGMTTDTPTHVSVYKNHLIFSFPGGSIQNSGVGAPYSWTAVTGASEIGLGEDVTGFGNDVSRALAIVGRNKIALLYGDNATDFVLEVVSEDSGGIEWTVQKLDGLLYHDDYGIRDMRTTQLYGDFRYGLTSQMVEPLFRKKKSASVSPACSLRCRKKVQYRLFWDDGTVLSIYLGRKKPECMITDYGSSIVANVAWSAEDSNGDELLFIGATDGNVYEVDAGTSLNGSDIDAFIRLPFNHVGSPTQKKRWFKATLEVDAAPNISLFLLAEYSYASGESPAVEQSFDVEGGGGFWNEDSWNEFYWSAPVESRAYAHINGIGENISLAVRSAATYDQPHTIHGVTLHYSYRGLKR